MERGEERRREERKERRLNLGDVGLEEFGGVRLEETGVGVMFASLNFSGKRNHFGVRKQQGWMLGRLQAAWSVDLKLMSTVHQNTSQPINQRLG